MSRLVFHSPLNPLGLSRVRRCNQGEGEALGLLCFRNAKLFLFMLAAVSQSREVVCCNRAPGELPPASPPPLMSPPCVKRNNCSLVPRTGGGRREFSPCDLAALSASSAPQGDSGSL